MNEAARRRLKNPPAKPFAGWFFAVAAVCGVVARVIHLRNGPQLVAEILIVIAVLLAAVSLVLKLRNWLTSRADK